MLLLATLARELAAFPVVLSCNVLAVLVAGPSWLRKAGAVVLCGLAFVAAAALPPPVAPLRGWLWFAAAMLAMRVVDVLRMVGPGASGAGVGPGAGVGARLRQLLFIYDPRDMRPAAPRVPVALVMQALAYSALSVAALGFAAVVPPPWRWLGGAIHFYALLEAADGALRSMYAAMGLDALPLQDRPLRARSLAELWGRRWNREVGRWIHRTCFQPLARRGHPALGVLAGFAWSATFHGAAAWAAAGVTWGALMAAFFLSHGVGVLAERALGVARWPRWAGHAWVIGVFAVTIPLFAEPILRLMGF